MTPPVTDFSVLENNDSHISWVFMPLSV